MISSNAKTTALKAGLAAIVLSLCTVTAVPARNEITLVETGSSLMYPLFSTWLPQFNKDNPGIRIATGSTGSGAGISQAVAGRVQIGASDAFMSDVQLHGHEDILNIPLAISAQQINYNVPGLNGAHLRLSGPVLAGIYSGTIQYWDDAQIKDLNGEYASRLPHKQIVPIRRADGSGDTFIFSQFLSFSTPAWDNGPGFGETVDWPSVPDERQADGNEGMLKANAQTPYSVAYIGISYQQAIARAHLGTAMLKNEDGYFVLPTEKTIYSAAAALGPRTPPDERLSLVFAPGEYSYPLINYEYAIVSKHQASDDVADAMRTFLFWSIEPCSGNAAKALGAVHFIALPEYIRALSYAQIAAIKGP